MKWAHTVVLCLSLVSIFSCREKTDKEIKSEMIVVFNKYLAQRNIDLNKVPTDTFFKKTRLRKDRIQYLLDFKIKNTEQSYSVIYVPEDEWYYFENDSICDFEVNDFDIIP